MSKIEFDVDVTFRDDGRIFSEVGERVSHDCLIVGLNLDVGVFYRKAALSDISNYLINKYSKRGGRSERFFKILSASILAAIYPGDSRIIFSEKDVFKSIGGLIKFSDGQQYIDAVEVEVDPDVMYVIEVLTSENLAVLVKGKYYIKDYYLESVTIS